MAIQRRDGLVVRIQIKDEQGHVVGEVDAVAFKGLLSLAHEEGLLGVKTRIIELPSEANGGTAVVLSRVKTRKGTFTGIGDANPKNVNRRIAPHVIRMAETRATARALRLAVNIGEVAIEELGDDVTIARASAPAPEPAKEAPRPADPSAPERWRGRDRRPTEADPSDRRAISAEQQKLVFRLCFDLGESRETVRARALKALGVERMEWATRVDGSRAIDALRAELARSRNGHSSNGMNGEAQHG
jgi:hypothetical protein